MATDLKSLGSELSDIEKQLSQYNADLPSQIESQIQKAYTPALQQSLEDTKRMMGDYLGRYFDVTTMGPGMAGTTAMDLSPTQKLGVMGRELGTMAGNLRASQQLSDYLGAQMNDMYGKAIQAAQMGQLNLADQYSRISQQYQLAWQQAEAEKDRQLQRELARSSGGGGGGGTVINLGTVTDTGVVTDPATKFIQKVKNWANKIKTDKSLDESFVLSSLVKEAKSLGLGYSTNQISDMLGLPSVGGMSTPKSTKSTIVNPTRYFDITGSGYGGLAK